jgi:hypothetical protein
VADSKPIPELDGRTWGELEVKRHAGGQLLFPDAIRRRDEKGVVTSVKVWVCVPSPEDQIEARVKARSIFRKREIDSVLDKDLFDEVEQICLLARAIRADEEPHAQLLDPEDLARYDEASLHDIQERINAYKAMLDPREHKVTEERFWVLVEAVGRSANLLPLTEFAGHVQPSLVVRMARAALSSRTSKSSAPSSESSTPEPSP